MKRRLGSTGLEVSPLGFGCYRVDEHSPAQKEALLAALDRGVNLIDTSTNYTDGSSERLVGQVLAERGKDGLVVVSKIGYVQGSNLRLARQHKLQGKPFPEVVEYSPGCWHCIHPEFLEDQLERSLRRLGLERLDVCLLHNPEYFLMEAAHRGQDVKDAFYSRLKASFAYFESQVAAGRIGCYGVSSNTVADPPSDPESTSLPRILEQAGEGFRVLQLPMNLIESEGALARHHGGKSVLELAGEANLGVLVNRPLNAFKGRSLLRLADPPELGAGQESLSELLERLRSLESPDTLQMARELETVGGRPLYFSDWTEVEQNQLWPYTLDTLDRLADSREDYRSWRASYLEAFHAVLLEIRRRSAQLSRARNLPLHEKLPARPGASLSQKALWTVVGTPGVTTALVGMRQQRYVEDACPVMGWEPPPDPLGVYGALTQEQ